MLYAFRNDYHRERLRTKRLGVPPLFPDCTDRN